jgi:hypothetical protein
VVVGLVAGALVLFPPRVTIESVTSDASDPLSTLFVIKNSWVLPLRDVVPFIGVCELRGTATPPRGPRILTVKGNCEDRAAVRLVPWSWPARNLGIDERFTVRMSDTEAVSAFHNHADWLTFAGGDITVGATFKIWPFPKQIQRMARFVAQKQRDGKFQWVPQALEEVQRPRRPPN